MTTVKDAMGGTSGPGLSGRVLWTHLTPRRRPQDGREERLSQLLMFPIMATEADTHTDCTSFHLERGAKTSARPVSPKNILQTTFSPLLPTIPRPGWLEKGTSALSGGRNSRRTSPREPIRLAAHGGLLRNGKGKTKFNKDFVKVPKGIPKGEYVLSWRWDTA